MIETLISSKTRIKLLLKFFLNSSMTAYLRNLETEFDESTNAIRLELNKFEKAGMLSSKMIGNKRVFQANEDHPLFGEIHSIVMKYVGLDQVVEYVVKRLGAVEQIYVAGKFARGLDSKVVDLIFVGEIDRKYLVELIEKVESLISRKIRYLIYSHSEYLSLPSETFEASPLLLWSEKALPASD